MQADCNQWQTENQFRKQSGAFSGLRTSGADFQESDRDNGGDGWSGWPIWKALPLLSQLFTLNENSLPRSFKRMMTSSTARAAWKCREGCAVHPLLQSTSFKGQRPLMNIWWKGGSSASSWLLLSSDAPVWHFCSSLCMLMCWHGPREGRRPGHKDKLTFRHQRVKQRSSGWVN